MIGEGSACTTERLARGVQRCSGRGNGRASFCEGDGGHGDYEYGEDVADKTQMPYALMLVFPKIF